MCSVSKHFTFMASMDLIGRAVLIQCFIPCVIISNFQSMHLRQYALSQQTLTGPKAET